MVGTRNWHERGPNNMENERNPTQLVYYAAIKEDVSKCFYTGTVPIPWHISLFIQIVTFFCKQLFEAIEKEGAFAQHIKPQASQADFSSVRCTKLAYVVSVPHSVLSQSGKHFSES